VHSTPLPPFSSPLTPVPEFLTTRPLRQVVEVIHPGLAGVSKKDLQEKLCKMYKVRLAATHTPAFTTRQQLHAERWPRVPGVAACSMCGPL
jgi:hypothetical protein